MRATRYKHCGNNEGRAKRNVKINKTIGKKRIKVFSVLFSVVAAAGVFIIPNTALAPDVNAYENSRAASFAVGDINQFSAIITENCVEVTTVPQTEIITEEATEKPTEEITEPETEAYEEETEELTEPEIDETEVEEVTEEQTTEQYTEEITESAEIVSEAVTEEDTEEVTEYVEEVQYQNALINISNPDYNYSPSYVSLSSYDRDKLERLVMGEAGSMGYEGCALVAQAIRDAMNRSGTSSIDAIISQYKYYGSTATAPNSTVKQAVSFIFDQNGSAVQHRVLCFYTGTSAWHETQTYIVGIGNVRFFDLNY